MRMVLDLETYRALGLDTPAPLAVNGRSRADFEISLNAPGDAVYHPCPEAYPSPDTPRGAISSHKNWSGGAIFADTRRDIRIYVPAGLDRAAAARVMVFNDGNFYFPRNGPVRATGVLDTLHAHGKIEPIVAVFVDPGRPEGSERGDAAAGRQRSVEYDSITDDYGRFLIEEVLPFVERAEGLTFSDDPAHRTMCGISSGGIAAFVAAWWFPGSFGRVLSHCGSFVNIRGGHNLAFAVRATPRKPIRVFLQSGEADASYITGDWPLANRTMASALDFAGYDYRFEFGRGGHSLRHGGAIFADSLRWLWRDEERP